MSEKKHYINFFPEPVFHYELDNFEQHNKDLLVYIYDLYENSI